ncbi:MAG: prolipoprotein diacylglyceryl transferase [Myxococcales bacterium]|nr:prolipoprotein diacylglyceryl transferase [Myxococcales bacterium]
MVAPALALPPTIGGLTPPWHTILEIAAFAIGFRYFLRLRARQGDTIADDARILIFLAATGGALVGSRLLGILERPDLLGGGDLVALFAAKTIVGGLLGGLVVVEWAKRRLGVVRSSGDLMVRPILLGMILGRIGCFLSGTTDGTHGLPTTAFTALDVGDGIPRHPAALYEIAALAGIWALIAALEARVRLRDGARFKLFLAAYLALRLGVDHLKPGHAVVAGLTAIQLACVAGLVYYWRVLLRPRRELLEPEPWPTASTPTTTSP